MESPEGLTDDARDAAAGPVAPLGERSRAERVRALVPIAMAVLVMVLVFGYLLPHVIDYRAVGEALASISPWWVLVLLVAGLLYVVPQGWLMSSVMIGMSLWQGMRAWVASVGVGSTVPALDMVTRFGMYRSWGFSTPVTMRGIVLTGVFDWTLKFSIPVVAVLLLSVAGAEDLGVLAVIAAVAGAILAVVLVVVIGVARSERFARGAGAFAQRVANAVLTRIKREPLGGLAERAVELRAETLGIIRRRGVAAFTASVSATMWQYVMLLLAVRAVQVPADVVSPLEVLVVWSMVLLITMIPITPGGVGIAELAYISFFAYIAGPEWSDILAAGVVLYRLIQFALPIPLGWAVALHWRSQVRRGIVPEPFARSAS